MSITPSLPEGISAFTMGPSASTPYSIVDTDDQTNKAEQSGDAGKAGASDEERPEDGEAQQKIEGSDRDPKVDPKVVCFGTAEMFCVFTFLSCCCSYAAVLLPLKGQAQRWCKRGCKRGCKLFAPKGEDSEAQVRKEREAEDARSSGDICECGSQGRGVAEQALDGLLQAVAEAVLHAYR